MWKNRKKILVSGKKDSPPDENFLPSHSGKAPNMVPPLQSPQDLSIDDEDRFLSLTKNNLESNRVHSVLSAPGIDLSSSEDDETTTTDHSDSTYILDQKISYRSKPRRQCALTTSGLQLFSSTPTDDSLLSLNRSTFLSNIRFSKVSMETLSSITSSSSANSLVHSDHQQSPYPRRTCDCAMNKRNMNMWQIAFI